MAIKRPDIYEHNNPNLPIVDSDFVKGGVRTAVPTLLDLYDLGSKDSQLKQFSTSVFVTGENKLYLLKDLNNVGNVSGWQEFNFGGGTNVVSTTGNQDISGFKNFLSRPTFNSTGLLIPSDLENIAIQISGLVEVSGDMVYLTGNQTVSGVKTFINTTQIDSVDFIRNFRATGTPYNFTSNQFFNFGPTGLLFTGWDLAPINPSDDSRSIKLSSGSYVIVTYTQPAGGGSVIEWKAVSNKNDLSNSISFNLYFGNTPFHRASVNSGPGTISVSGFLPREYDRFIIRYVGGGGLFPSVNVSGDFGVNNEIRLESRDNRLFLGNSGVLFQGEAATAQLPDTIVFTTGNQTISGLKSFTTRPTVNGTGVLLSGEAAQLPETIVYTTGNQTISGIKNIMNEPSGGGSFSAGNILIGQNDNSVYLGRTQIEENSWDLKTSTIGTGWALALPAANTSGTDKRYFAIETSSKGNFIAASVQYTQNITSNSIINISEDYGKTWSTKFELGLSSTRSPNILSIAMSVDGKFITIGATLSSPSESKVFVSTDYGNTWVNRLNTFSVGASYVSMSSDGRIQTAVQYNGNIYVSTNYGNTWIQITFNLIGTNKWNGISMSSDGRIQAACRDGQPLAVSYDYGNSWTNKDTNRAWRSIKMSSDGRIQVAVTTVGSIFAKSIDYGQNWQIINNTTSAIDITSSSNGKILLFAGISTLYTSNNYGDTVIESPLPAAGNSYSVGMSSDGRIQCIGIDGAGIYISKASLITQSNVDFIERPTVNGTGVLLSGEAVTSNGTINTMVKLTQSQYNALSLTDSTTFYVIVG